MSVNIHVRKLLISQLQSYIGYGCKILAFCELISYAKFIIKIIVYFVISKLCATFIL